VAPYFVRGSSWLFVFIFEELVNYRTHAANKECGASASYFTISVFFLLGCQKPRPLLQQTVSLLLKRPKPGLAAMTSPMAGPKFVTENLSVEHH
jgi:hypothetical protein